MKIAFWGAAREVTGSNTLVEAAGKKILLDCGLFQGSRLNDERNSEPFAYNPAAVDFVVVCHSHLDHTGRLPKLYRDGFRGRIYATAPTKELAYLVLLDGEKLMAEEARRNGGKILYGKEDIDGVMELFEALGYDETLEISPGIKLTFKNAGHILGSAMAQIEADGKVLIYTSDLGNNPSELLDPPATTAHADYLICESTYGGRVHEDISRRQEKLNSIIESTIAQNGVLMIPTFAIERTQELLHDIEHFCNMGNCLVPNFYLDSPLAEKVTAVFEKYPEFLNGKVRTSHDKDIFGLERIIMTSTARESQQIDGAPSPKVIIAGSGMLNGGRILFHLQRYIGDPKNTLLIVGYQAAGTLGRRLLDGEKEVKIFGKTYKVEARVLAIGSYSAHADNPQILAWVAKISGIQKVFLVHGESSQATILARDLADKLNLTVLMPQIGEEYLLN
ncbi:MAG: MBL fold metallo-hydrolase [Candidatus Curtissbacteria bacterium]|nr:MBL fold metallo-hydrolase [Candidatus Curtissbacteria bacterium]